MWNKTETSTKYHRRDAVSWFPSLFFFRLLILCLHKQFLSQARLASFSFMSNEILCVLLVCAPAERVRSFWPQFFFFFFSSLHYFTALLSLTAYISQRINLSKLFSVQPPPSRPIKRRERHLLYWSFSSPWINSVPAFLRSCFPSLPFLFSFFFVTTSCSSRLKKPQRVKANSVLWFGICAAWNQCLTHQLSEEVPKSCAGEPSTRDREVYISPAPRLTPALARWKHGRLIQTSVQIRFPSRKKKNVTRWREIGTRPLALCKGFRSSEAAFEGRVTRATRGFVLRGRGGMLLPSSRLLVNNIFWKLRNSVF